MRHARYALCRKVYARLPKELLMNVEQTFQTFLDRSMLKLAEFERPEGESYRKLEDALMMALDTRVSTLHALNLMT